MRLKTRRAVDWKAACTVLSGEGGQDNASTEAYIESEKRIELRNDNDTEKSVIQIDY